MRHGESPSKEACHFVNDEIGAVRQLENGAPGTEATVRCVPPPGWVKHQEYSVPGTAADDAYVDNGLRRLLYDSQISLEATGFANYLRTVQSIISRAGAEKAAHFAVEFDPTYQRIDVHAIRVSRGESHIDHANAASFQLLRRETRLEKLALDGRLTASLLISDLRVDDVLDVAITIRSHHPVLGCNYAGWIAFNSTAPWLDARHRLLRPFDRELFQKPFNRPPEGAICNSHGTCEMSWSLAEQERLQVEDLSPPWKIQAPAIQLTEFRSWNQIALLFCPYYADSELPSDLAAEVDRLANEFPDAADRVAEWLRFVQRQLRYFALAFGEGGLIPRSIDVIWRSRFGDCKDAARLFVAGARKMGADVCAALVSTTHGPAIGELLPSPAVFNHCIVRVRLNGRTYWLDPTMPRQEGRLDVIYQPHAGWALPLIPDSSLESLPDNEPVHYRHTEGDLKIGSKVEEPAVLTFRVDLYSFAADALRHRIEDEGHSKYSEQVITELRTTWPELVETAPLSFMDERADNRLTAVFRYEIRNAWKPVDQKRRLGFRIAANSIAAELNPLKKTQRRTDIFLGRPRRSTWRVRIHMPRAWRGSGWNEVLNPTNLRVSNELAITEQTLILTKEILISAWTMPASEASAYQELVTKLRTNVTTVFASTFLGRIFPATGGPLGLTRRQWFRLGWVVLWAGYLLYVALKPSPRP
jgi:Domain of Unknown Function with PDB structure (DUF3857)